MADTSITPGSGTLTLSGKGPPPRLPVYQLNGTDAAITWLLGPYQLNGTDSVDGAEIGPYELPGADVSRTTPVGVLSLVGIAPDVINSGNPNVSKTPPVVGLVLQGIAPSVLQNTIRQPTTGSLILTGAAVIRAPYADITWEPWTAEGLLIQGSLGSSEVAFRPWTAAATLSSPYVISAALEWAPWTARGTFPLQAAVEFVPWTATGRVMELLRAAPSWSAWKKYGISAAVSFEPWTASARLQPTLSDVYTAKVMNTRNIAITEYTNYAFNSFAKIGDDYYGAGPAGLVRLSGATDNGSNVSWSLRTGQMDDKTAVLKRLPEILLSLRSNGPVRVRVWKDDSTYYDYMLPAVKPDTIHQHRVTPGKGMRSKYYMVELQGVNNADLELDDMIVNMVETKRRVG